MQSPSNEGSSNVLLEASAVGCPTVSTDCGDARERLSDDRVVPIGDDEPLADAALGALFAPTTDAAPQWRGAMIVVLVSATLDYLGLGGPHDETPVEHGSGDT